VRGEAGKLAADICLENCVLKFSSKTTR